MLRRFVAGLGLALLAAVSLFAQAMAQEIDADPRVQNALSLVQTWLEAQRAYEQMPGLSAEVIYDQKALWNGDTTPEMPKFERGKNLASGYSAITRNGTRRPTPFFHARGIAPAAGYASTVEDLGRFASWQFRLLADGKSEVLNANTLREMHRVHFIDFSDPSYQAMRGLGFEVWRDKDKTFVGHGGSCPGFQSHLLMQPEDKVATVFMVNAQGFDFRYTQRYAQRMYDIVAPAIRAVIKEADKAKQPDPELEHYLGTYESLPYFGGEMAVVRWEDGLAILSLPTMEPVKSLIKLKKTADHRFRRIRSDENLGEEVIFELGPDGKATRFIWNNNYFPRMKSAN
jgi:hypothetical protein